MDSPGWALDACEAPRGVQYDSINQSINRCVAERGSEAQAQAQKQRQLSQDRILMLENSNATSEKWYPGEHSRWVEDVDNMVQMADRLCLIELGLGLLITCDCN